MDGTKEWTFEIAIVEHQFQKLMNYFQNMSQYIIDQKSGVEAGIKNAIDTGADSEYYSDDWYIIEILEQQFCHLMIVSIYTLIEKELAKIQKNIRKTKIDFDLKKEKSTIFINGIKVIRNIIAHENGELLNTKKKDIDQIKAAFLNNNIHGFSIKNADSEKMRHRIELNLEFITYCLKKSKEELQNIIQQIKKCKKTK